MGKSKLPPPLPRCPAVGTEIQRSKADEAAYRAIERVAGKLLDKCDSHLRMTKGHLLRSMKLTHRSMVVLVTKGKQEHSGDLLPLTRLQVERLFVCMLLTEDPDKYLPRFRKAAWKAHATSFYRDQAELGHLNHCKEYYATQEAEIAEFGRMMDADDDEIATLAAQLKGQQLGSGFSWKEIPVLPNLASVEDVVSDPGLKAVARRFYLAYNELCHYSHGGFLGVMIGGLLGGKIKSVDASGADVFFERQVVERTFPCSYVCMMTAATLFGLDYLDDPDLVATVIAGWSPHLCDAMTLGIVVWDAWAKQALGALT